MRVRRAGTLAWLLSCSAHCLPHSDRPSRLSAAPGWVLDERTERNAESTWPPSCPPGQRNAVQDECMEAVQAAAVYEGLDVVSYMKVVDVPQDDGAVPYGCSYSHAGNGGGHAVFNRNPAGRSDSSVDGLTYRLACIDGDASAEGALSRPGALSEAECLTQLNSLPDAVVAVHEGLIWCPTAKAGTTSMTRVLNRRFNGADVDLARAWTAADRLVGNAAEVCIPAGTMSRAAKHLFCAQRSALSFSVMRNPWERVLSFYIEKVAAGEHRPALVERILHDIGLPVGDTISFPQFVLWLSGTQPGPDDDVHIMPWCASHMP